MSQYEHPLRLADTLEHLAEYGAYPSVFNGLLRDAASMIRALADVVADLASTAQDHAEVYYSWEQTVRTATGPVRSIIETCSSDEFAWDSQLPGASS